jgi:hypothetical protein
LRLGFHVAGRFQGGNGWGGLMAAEGEQSTGKRVGDGSGAGRSWAVWCDEVVGDVGGGGEKF